MVQELRERTAFICLPFCYQSLKEGSQDMVRKISNCHLILIPSFALVIVSVKCGQVGRLYLVFNLWKPSAFLLMVSPFN